MFNSWKQKLTVPGVWTWEMIQLLKRLLCKHEDPSSRKSRIWQSVLTIPAAGIWTHTDQNLRNDTRGSPLLPTYMCAHAMCTCIHKYACMLAYTCACTLATVHIHACQITHLSFPASFSTAQLMRCSAPKPMPQRARLPCRLAAYIPASPLLFLFPAQLLLSSL